MLSRLLVLIFLWIGIAAESSASGTPDFTGSWDAPESDVSAFSLDLVQTGTRIKGYHAAVAHGGKRIDAVLPSDGRPSITGTVSGGVAHVRFESGYDESGGGEATLTLRGNKLEWKVTKSSGIHYLPASSILQRQNRKRVKASNLGTPSNMLRRHAFCAAGPRQKSRHLRPSMSA